MSLCATKGVYLLINLVSTLNLQCKRNILIRSYGETYLVMNPPYFLPEVFPHSTNCRKYILWSQCRLKENSLLLSPFLIFPVQSVEGSLTLMLDLVCWSTGDQMRLELELTRAKSLNYWQNYNTERRLKEEEPPTLSLYKTESNNTKYWIVHSSWLQNMIF